MRWALFCTELALTDVSGRGTGNEATLYLRGVPQVADSLPTIRNSLRKCTNGEAAHLKLELFNDIHGDLGAICIRLCQVQACNQG